jgi:pimeloyl-ACP methyl ester carboxylesterase
MRRRVSAVLTVLLGACIVAGPQQATAADPDCSAGSTAATGNQSASRRPVVFVHGWASDGSTFHETGAYLKQQTGDRIQPYYFDYKASAAFWAAHRSVSGCLATYLKDVSKAYHDAGGDGRLIVVAHSMGGLAALYAAGDASVPPLIGGLVTFDAPFLGSPFGNGDLAATLEGLKQDLGRLLVPPKGSDAQVCLGRHTGGAALPRGCDAQLPGFLPPTVPVAQIAGQITVQRTVAGVHLYDLVLGGDGIVSTTSSWGYLEARAKKDWPMGAKNTLRTADCVMSSDTVRTAVMGLRLTKDARAAVLAAAAQFYVDNKALDDLLADRVGYAAAIYMGAAQVWASCSHIRITDDQVARDHALTAIKAYLEEMRPATVTVNIAPVDKRGNPVAGWSIDRSRIDGVAPDCSFNSASSAAPADDIYYCSPTSAGSDACWVAADRIHIYCLTDPESHTVVELTPASMPTGPAERTEAALPIRLDLDNSDRCRFRNGGSWDGRSADPGMVGWYRCTKAQAVWAAKDAPINTSGKTWTVRTGGSTGALTEHRVTTAYYVATAP